MLWVPQKGIVRCQHNTGTVGSATPGTSVTTGAAASTKGSWAELIAATAFDAYWVLIIAANYFASATASEGCIDIGIGAATEEVLIPDLLMGNCGFFAATGRSPKQWAFPLYIPAGSRLAARAAGARTSAAMRVGIYLYGGNGSPPFRVGSKVTTYGMGTVPNGTSITPGASGAEGSWTQVVASTSEDHFALLPSFQPSADTTLATRSFAYDLGIGSATEEEIAQSWWFNTSSDESMDGMFPCMPAFVDVPAGTRLAARVSNSGVNDGAYNTVIHAVS